MMIDALMGRMPNGDFSEAILNSSFDCNGKREPMTVATENDSLNGVAMLFGKLLTNTAQVFCDVRTYRSPTAIRRVFGQLPEGAKAGVIHLINSGAAALDETGQAERSSDPAIKPFWELTETKVQNCLEATEWCPADLYYFRGGGFSSRFFTRGEMIISKQRRQEFAVLFYASIGWCKFKGKWEYYDKNRSGIPCDYAEKSIWTNKQCEKNLPLEKALI